MEDIRTMERETKALLDAKVLLLALLNLQCSILCLNIYDFAVHNILQIADSSQQVQNVSMCLTTPPPPPHAVNIDVESIIIAWVQLAPIYQKKILTSHTIFSLLQDLVPTEQ